MIAFDYIAIIISIISIGIAWKAFSTSRESLAIQKEAHHIHKGDLTAKQKPKIQVTNETFLNSWQRGVSREDCLPEELDIEYSAVYENKGESTVRIDGVSIELCPTGSPTGDPKHGLGCLVFGPSYISPGDAASINKIITSNQINMTRMFFDDFSGVLVFILKIRYMDHIENVHIYEKEIYRLNQSGGIISKGNYDAASGKPLSYLVRAAT